VYLIADIKQHISNHLSQINIPDNVIDLSDVVIFDNAVSFINELFQRGYTLVDTKDAFRNELLRKNLDAIQISSPIKDTTDMPADLDKIMELITGFNEEEIYNCRNSKLYPLITLTQLSRPGVKWTFSGDSWIEYGNYVAGKIYYRNGSPKLKIFIDTIKSSERLFIVRSNSFVEFANPFLTENEIARVPFVEPKWTWAEIFYRATLIPADFGKVKLTEKPPWKDAITSIIRDCSPKTTQKITLNQYMRGVVE